MEHHLSKPHLPDAAPEGVDELSFRVFRALMRTVKLNGRMLMRALGREGAHPGQAGLLWALGIRDGVTQRDLADMVQLAPPTVTAMLQKMERAGLVVREPDAADQRLVRVALTAAGRETNERLHRAHGEYIATTIGSLTARDRRELARLLGLLGDNIAEALAGQGECCGPGGPAEATDDDAGGSAG